MRRRVTPSTADAISWALLSGLAVACFSISLALEFDLLLVRAVLPSLGVAALIAALATGRSLGNARLVAGATAFLQMTLFTILGVVLAYLLAARARPLWDAKLVAVDARLGLDWPAILEAADRIPAPFLLLGGVAYHSLTAQMVLCVLVLAGTGRFERLRVVVAAAVLSGVVTILASGLMPAMGNLFDPARYQALWPSVAWLDRELISGLRDGSVRQIDLSHMTGIVSFPSYHAALPLILAWGLHPILRLRVPAALWAGLTIAATPLFGGHYGVDVLAGVLLGAGALAVATRLPSEFPAAKGCSGGQLWYTPGGHRWATPHRRHGRRRSES